MGVINVATFNVNSVRSRLHILDKWLSQKDIDILCLQETKTQDQTFPTDFFEEKGYKVAFRGEKGYNGVAIASRYPLENVVYGFGDGSIPSGETRLIQAKIASISLINAYVPQGKSIEHENYKYKLSFLKRIGDVVNTNYSTEENILWVGDLNVAPSDLDVTKPETKKNHVCFHEDVKSVFESVRGTRFTDVFRKFRPGEGEFSFWDYRVKDSLKRNIGWRIDHVLATEPLSGMCLDCYVDRDPRSWEKPSDHTPVVSVFDIPGV